ncbi:MAG TPA: NYN domain-containing protein [Pseudonocardiaceae bacterium]|jgi:hypothetical protein|nr:NYN domain-containing protein [Pseudonocardiaceae bacterium]
MATLLATQQVSATTRVGVYVDAFNVYYGGRSLCGRGTAGWRWLDLAGLAMDLINPRIWPNARLERLVYCTAFRDRKGDPSSLADQQTYVNALCHHNDSVAVAEGIYRPRVQRGVLVDPNSKSRGRVCSPGADNLPGWLPAEEVTGPSGQAELLVAVTTFEEKGTDVNVASHLLIDVLTQRIDAAMVLSNDSDLQFPLAEARRHVPVATINPRANRTSDGLRGDTDGGAGSHWWRRLKAADLVGHQLPDVVGSHVKPPGW